MFLPKSRVLRRAQRIAEDQLALLLGRGGAGAGDRQQQRDGQRPSAHAQAPPVAGTPSASAASCCSVRARRRSMIRAMTTASS